MKGSFAVATLFAAQLCVGSFTVEGQFNSATGTTAGSFEGTLSSPGGSKS